MQEIIKKYLAKPHLVLSFVLLMAMIGIMGYIKMPLNLYPDTDRPQIMVITVESGASASDVESKISRVVEKELTALDNVVRVSSTSKDEVSVITVEFDYNKTLDAGATDVNNGLNKIMAQLPSDIKSPQIFKISQATQPTAVVALHPKDGLPLDLSQVRQLADNEIKEELLKVPGIAQIEVFGGFKPEIVITVNSDALARYGLTIGDVTSAMLANNINIPNGMIIKNTQQYLLKTQGEFTKPEDAANILVGSQLTGDIYLRDVAKVERGIAQPQSAYRGNGYQAIGISILRSISGHTMDGVTAIENYLPTLQANYPGIDFTISDTQGTLIRTTIENMQGALREAILLTVLVVFLFLGNMRVTLLAAISIPFTYLITFAVLWLIGYELNMIVLTGVILAVGMLLDDAIVVIENIARHYEENPGKLEASVIGGTQEVLLAIFSGTYATIMVVVPIIFIGGYVQMVMGPLILPICIALGASYIVSVTIIPIMAPMLLKAHYKPNFFEKIANHFNDKVVAGLRDFFMWATGIALKKRLVFIILAIVIFVVSARQMPIVGREVQASMDTGIVKVNFETSTDMSLADTLKIASNMEEKVMQIEGVQLVSTIIGSEPGIVSFGSGKLPQSGSMTIRMEDRFHRSKNIWQIEQELREAFGQIPGLKYADVFDFGATPMSSVKATVDVMISGPDRKVLDDLGRQVENKLQHVSGLINVSRSWTFDKQEVLFIADKERCNLYGISATGVSRQVAQAVRGNPASIFRIEGQDGTLFRVQYPEQQRNDITKLMTMNIMTAKGPVPLQVLGKISFQNSPTFYTRQSLQNTIDIYGYREKAAITHLDEAVQAAIKDIELPRGYTISQEGDVKLMNLAFKSLFAALAIGLVLLYFSLVPAFGSFIHPLTIMSVIPFGLIGAVWALLASNKHSAMPAFIGLILLSGIVVKNSILLIDFILEERQRGASLEQAIMGSIRTRTRPIIMTAVGTAVGMLPIAMQWGVGLERLSPLAVVTIGGLFVSTVLTLIYVPIFYTLFEEVKSLGTRRKNDVDHKG